MKGKKCILFALADGVFGGLCCYLATALLLSGFFPVNTAAFELLAAVTAVVSSVPLWLVLPRYTGLKQKLLHLAVSVLGFLLYTVLDLVNGLTVNWRPIPLLVSSDADGVLVLLFLGLVLLFTAVLRLILILARKPIPICSTSDTKGA